MTMDKVLRVLIVEDSPIDSETIVSELELAGLTIDAERIDRKDDLEIALKSAWDVVIYDFIVPGMDWRQSLASVRKRFPDLPFIIVSGKRGEEYAVETIRAGCNDYVVKDRLLRLAPAVLREVTASAEREQNLQERRTLELELQQSRRVEAAGRLARGLAHNLKNVLMVIMGGLDLVLHDRKNDENKSYLEDAVRAVESAAKMVRQLEDLGSEPEFRPAAISIEALINHIDVLVRPILPELVTLKTDCEPNIPLVIADSGLLEHALLNLLLNARDAVGDNGHISLNANRSKQSIIIRVDDNGAGVPEELRLQIFEPFFSTKGKGGSGLGLSTVYEAVRAHDGTISSKPGKSGGSIFEIRLPLIEAPEGDQADEHAWTHGTGTVLVLDDAEDSLLAARGILERCGYEVKLSTSLDDAQRLLKRGLSVDVILVETMIQGGGARDLLRWLDECFRPVPVIAISAYQSERWERYRLYEGFAAFLSKPFNGAQLSHTVSRFCDAPAVSHSVSETNEVTH